MANNGTLILYNYPINGGGFSSNISANEGSNPDLAKTTFSWSVASQDIINNTSTINWTLTVENLNKYDLSSFIIDELYLINASTSSTIYYTGTSVDVLTNTTAYTGSFTLEHNTNGALSVPIKIRAYMKAITTNGISYYSNYAIDNTTTLTLDAIPRHAVIQSAPNFTDEDSPTITFAIPNGATNVRVYIAFSTNTIDIGPYAVSGSSYTFNFNETEKAKLWSILDEGLDTKQVYFYVMSDHQGTTYYSSLIRTLTVINYTPIIAPEVYDTNAAAITLTGDKYKLIRYVSNAYWKTGAQGRKGATIETQLVANGGKTYYGAYGTIDGVSNPIFDFSAVDSYGRSITSNYNVELTTGSWIPYIKLTCSVSTTEMTGDGDAQVTLNGKYFDGSFGNTTNTLHLTYDLYKNNEIFRQVDSGYISPTVDSEGNYTYNFTISGLEYMSVYELTAKVSDKVSSTPVEISTVIASTPIFDWGCTDFNFNVPVTIQGGSVITIISQGTTTSGWTYRKWSDGVAECWATKTFDNVAVTKAWGNIFTSGAISGSNLTLPTNLFIETPTVNISLATGSLGGIIMASEEATTNITSTTNTGALEIVRGTSSTGTFTINYDVKGRWK